jgi:hypothetical protein
LSQIYKKGIISCQITRTYGLVIYALSELGKQIDLDNIMDEIIKTKILQYPLITSNNAILNQYISFRENDIYNKDNIQKLYIEIELEFDIFDIIILTSSKIDSFV